MAPRPVTKVSCPGNQNRVVWIPPYWSDCVHSSWRSRVYPRDCFSRSSPGYCAGATVVSLLRQRSPIINEHPPFMFADDTTGLIIQNRQTPTKNALAVQTALRDIDQWAKAWLVKFNTMKSEDLVITGGKRFDIESTRATLAGEVIPQVDTVKHLGVHISRDLRWKSHVHSLLEKVRGRIGMLHRISYRYRSFFLRQMYVAGIRSTLEYASAV